MQQFVGTWLGAAAEDMRLDTAPASSPIRQASGRLTANEPGPWLGAKQSQKAYGPAGWMRLIAAMGIRSDIAQRLRPIERDGPAEPCRFLAARTEALLVLWAVCICLIPGRLRNPRWTRTRWVLEFQAGHLLIHHLQSPPVGDMEP